MRTAQKLFKLSILRFFLTLHIAKQFKYNIAVILDLSANDSSVTDTSLVGVMQSV